MYIPSEILVMMAIAAFVLLGRIDDLERKIQNLKKEELKNNDTRK